MGYALMIPAALALREMRNETLTQALSGDSDEPGIRPPTGPTRCGSLTSLYTDSRRLVVSGGQRGWTYQIPYENGIHY